MSTYASQSLAPANAAYVASFGAKGALAMPPAKKLAFVVCMDARIDPAAAFGLKEGDAHVIRNAGGRVVEAIRSLVISQELLGTREIVVVHHTDCGMLTFTSAQAASLVKARVGHEHHAAVDAIAFQEFSDVATSVEADVAFLKAHPLILKETVISGYTYHVETGAVTKVV